MSNPIQVAEHVLAEWPCATPADQSLPDRLASNRRRVTLRNLWTHARTLDAELRQAWAKVRAEIEAEVGGPDLSRSDGMFQALQSDLAAANAKIAELEGRLASLTSVSEDDVKRVAKAMFVSVRKDIPWAKAPSTLRTTWLEYTRATLITFVSR